MDDLILTLTDPNMTNIKFNSLLFRVNGRKYVVMGKDKTVFIYKTDILNNMHNLCYFHDIPQRKFNDECCMCKNVVNVFKSKSINITGMALNSELYKLSNGKLIIFQYNFQNNVRKHSFDVINYSNKYDESYIRWIRNYQYFLAIYNVEYFPKDVQKYILSFIL
jgi:hypothetical protein